MTPDLRTICTMVVAVAGIGGITTLAALHDIPAGAAVTVITGMVGLAAGHGLSLTMLSQLYRLLTRAAGTDDAGKSGQ